VVTAANGGVLWRRYGDGLLVVARRDETPDQALQRESGNDPAGHTTGSGRAC
jgi:hypothetical protein